VGFDLGFDLSLNPLANEEFRLRSCGQESYNSLRGRAMISPVGCVFSEPDLRSHCWVRLSSLLPTGRDNYSDDHHPGDHETNARADPKRVEHGEQEDKEQRTAP
jgi:hypothetical protein